MEPLVVLDCHCLDGKKPCAVFEISPPRKYRYSAEGKAATEAAPPASAATEAATEAAGERAATAAKEAAPEELVVNLCETRIRKAPRHTQEEYLRSMGAPHIK